MAANLMEIDEFQVDLASELGRGAFGTVYTAFRKDDKFKLAVKKLKQTSSKLRVNIDNLRKLNDETGETQNVGLQNILLAHTIVEVDGHIWVFMPLCKYGDLNSYFCNHFSSITDTLKLDFMQQITLGLSFLHGRKIVHRDIKPANILVSSVTDNSVPILKLSDFDLSKFLGPEEVSVMSTNVGTAAFMAPEFWNFTTTGAALEYTKGVDIFAAGLVFLSILQAQQDSSLRPSIEGTSVTEEEAGQFIGLAMQIRKQNLQDPLKVAVLKLSDSVCIRRIKRLICQMTDVDDLERLDVWQASNIVHHVLSTHSNADLITGGLRVGDSVASVQGVYVYAIHVTDEGEIVICSKEAVKMYTLECDLIHEWKTNIDEPTGMTTATVKGVEYILISQVISEKAADETTPPSTNDRIEIQLKDKSDRGSEIAPWGPVAYSTPGECGIGSNLILLKSGHVALAVKESDEAPSILHILKCSTSDFECQQLIKTDSIHPPAICSLQLGVKRVIAVGDVCNANEECSIVFYEEDTGDAVKEINNKVIKQITGDEEHVLYSICATGHNTILISNHQEHAIFEVSLGSELNSNTLLNGWDFGVWEPTPAAWNFKYNSLIVSHKSDNNARTTYPESISVFTIF